MLPSSDVETRVRRAGDECLPAAVNRSRPHYRVSTVLVRRLSNILLLFIDFVDRMQICGTQLTGVP